MNLFGVKAQLVVNNHKKEFKTIRPIFEEWLKLNRDYIELAEQQDNLYWYNERATISSLAGAVWRCGGFAQEEYSAIKGKGNKARTGRVDLYFHFNNTDVVCEAKQLFLYLPEYNKKDLKQCIEASLAWAKKDLNETALGAEYQDFGIALAFIVPYKHENEDIQVTKKQLAQAVKELDCSFYVSLEVEGKPMIGGSGHEYNHVLLVGTII